MQFWENEILFRKLEKNINNIRVVHQGDLAILRILHIAMTVLQHTEISFHAVTYLNISDFEKFPVFSNEELWACLAVGDTEAGMTTLLFYCKERYTGRK